MYVYRHTHTYKHTHKSNTHSHGYTPAHMHAHNFNVQLILYDSCITKQWGNRGECNILIAVISLVLVYFPPIPSGIVVGGPLEISELDRVRRDTALQKW